MRCVVDVIPGLSESLQKLPPAWHDYGNLVRWPVYWHIQDTVRAVLNTIRSDSGDLQRESD